MSLSRMDRWRSERAETSMVAMTLEQREGSPPNGGLPTPLRYRFGASRVMATSTWRAGLIGGLKTALDCALA